MYPAAMLSKIMKIDTHLIAKMLPKCTRNSVKVIKRVSKRAPKIMKETILKKWAKMTAKGSKRDGKSSRNGIQNHEKINTKFDCEKWLKKHGKSIEKIRLFFLSDSLSCFYVTEVSEKFNVEKRKKTQRNFLLIFGDLGPSSSPGSQHTCLVSTHYFRGFMDLDKQQSRWFV